MTKDDMIGETIKNLLQEKGMKQKELADSVGITEVTMSRYILGQREVKLGTAAKIAKVFNVSTDYLMNGNENSERAVYYQTKEETEGDEEMIQLVIVKHKDSGKYLFRVPEGKSLKAGDNVSVDTCYGEQYGICCCDSFYTEKVKDVCEMFGTQEEKLKAVTGIIKVVKWEDEA